ncbi:MAG TPA: SDR family NAD(P)-dependent oxidoreductase [Solirubrobacteraceae bacterium]|nr:SDR family NAD(P)-dependent oxidoreductase [Solirubrobacteraceae bacterium]
MLRSITESPHLHSTVALVTGASSGIGEATALALAAQGATVALVARRGERLEALAARIGAQAFAIAADLTDPAAPPRVIEEVVARAGRLDILVNNAGLMLLGPIEGAPLSEWERMIDLNVRALVHCAHAALPHLLEAASQGPRNVADMVNVSSVAGRLARNGSGVYNLTKWGVGAFSESLRQEVTARHVRVGLVEPGATESELVEQNRPEIINALSLGAMQRMASADIADAIIYMVTRPRHVAVNEILIRPTEQER